LVKILTEGITLFALLKSKKQANGLTAVSITDVGVAISRINRDDVRKPILDLCLFEPLSDPAEVRVMLDRVIQENALDGERCSIVIPNANHSLLLIEAPDVQATELKAAVRWRIKDLIDFHIDDAVIDVFEIPEQDVAPGRARLMYAVAARASALNSQIEILQDSAFDLEIVEIPELAIRNITALLDEDVRGVATLYFNNEGGVITLTRQGSLYLSRNIDIGISQFSVPGSMEGELHPQVQQSLDKVVLEVQRSLDYYESHFSQPPITQLLVAPLAEEVPGMLTYLSSNLGLATRMIDINDIVECAVPIDMATQANSFTAIGAALRYQQKTL